jgi:uncharacterized protein (DUF4415 family)
MNYAIRYNKYMEEHIDIIKGDKVLVLRGEYQGIRGTIDDVQGDTAKVVFSESNATLPIELLQNFSSAARKAWQTRPQRAVGRPKDPNITPKRMVSLRLDIDLWNELGKAVELGMIRSREDAVNQWLREKLNDLQVRDNKIIISDNKGSE